MGRASKKEKTRFFPLPSNAFQVSSSPNYVLWYQQIQTRWIFVANISCIDFCFYFHLKNFLSAFCSFFLCTLIASSSCVCVYMRSWLAMISVQLKISACTRVYFNVYVCMLYSTVTDGHGQGVTASIDEHPLSCLFDHDWLSSLCHDISRRVSACVCVTIGGHDQNVTASLQ